MGIQFSCRYKLERDFFGASRFNHEKFWIWFRFVFGFRIFIDRNGGLDCKIYKQIKYSLISFYSSYWTLCFEAASVSEKLGRKMKLMNFCVQYLLGKIPKSRGSRRKKDLGFMFKVGLFWLKLWGGVFKLEKKKINGRCLFDLMFACWYLISRPWLALFLCIIKKVSNSSQDNFGTKLKFQVRLAKS